MYDTEHDYEAENGSEPIQNGGAMIVFDDVELGRLLRGARKIAGFDSPEQMNERLLREFGVQFSPRGVLAIERGDQQATLEQFMTMLLLYRPPGGIEFFYGAVKPQYLEAFKRLLVAPR